MWKQDGEEGKEEVRNKRKTKNMRKKKKKKEMKEGRRKSEVRRAVNMRIEGYEGKRMCEIKEGNGR